MPPRTPSAPVALAETAAGIADLWSPRVVAFLNDHLVKVARVRGEFPWHVHDSQDELFLVLHGILRIGRADADGGPVELHAGECFVIPRGVRHNTSTPGDTETLLALIEPADTLHTGGELTPLTRSIAEQFGQ